MPSICSFDIFDKRVLLFVGIIRSNVFFFLATILIMAVFSFQFWVRIKIFHMHNKSNCFRTVELHVVQLNCNIHLIALTDLILYYFNLLYYWSSWTEYSFLQILSSFARSQVKTLTVNFRLLSRKTSISGISLTFFY